jgi:hypothetical protein
VASRTTIRVDTAVKFILFAETIMEAERINAIANRLHDLEERAGALRRYL